MRTPTLKTERLLLRPFSTEDTQKEVVGAIHKNNPASGNVLKKCDFQYKKTFHTNAVKEPFR